MFFLEFHLCCVSEHKKMCSDCVHVLTFPARRTTRKRVNRMQRFRPPHAAVTPAASAKRTGQDISAPILQNSIELRAWSSYPSLHWSIMPNWNVSTVHDSAVDFVRRVRQRDEKQDPGKVLVLLFCQCVNCVAQSIKSISSSWKVKFLRQFFSAFGSSRLK